jgi:catechol 2,3-dioxygenase-like lactoylglutathione lyase family enzyme
MQFVESVRRVTITTDKIEESLRFYRDALRMKIWYDGTIHDAQVNELFGLLPSSATRVVILYSGQNYVAGMIGLMEFQGENLASMPRSNSKTPLAGEAIIMMTALRIKELYENLLQYGFEIIAPPTRLEIPNRECVYEMMTRDPNGVRVTFAQQGEIERQFL